MSQYGYQISQKNQDDSHDLSKQSALNHHQQPKNYQTNSAANIFRQNLLKKKLKNAHLKFFFQSKITSLVLPVVAASTQTQLIPFRNKRCLLPDCIYDLEDLVNIFKANGNNHFISFNCNHCDRELDIDDFKLDKSFHDVIDHVWKEFNKNNNLVCTSITLNKDGTWKPNVPPYLDKIFSAGTNKFMKDNTNRKIASILDEGGQAVIEEEKLKWFPLSSFSKTEYKELQQELQSKKLKNTDYLIKNENISLQVCDYDNFSNGHFVSNHTLSFFLYYLQSYQNENKIKLNKSTKLRWKFYILKICLLDLAKFEYKKNYVGCFFNNFKNNPKEIYKEYNMLSIILKVDDRWIIVLVNLLLHQYYVADFLSEDLSKIHDVLLLNLVCQIVQKEFNLALKMKTIIKVPKLEFYSDCALEVMHFLSKSILLKSPEKAIINFQDNNLFTNQASWLILKLGCHKTRELVYFLPEEDQNSTDATKALNAFYPSRRAPDQNSMNTNTTLHSSNNESQYNSFTSMKNDPNNDIEEFKINLNSSQQKVNNSQHSLFDQQNCSSSKINLNESHQKISLDINSNLTDASPHASNDSCVLHPFDEDNSIMKISCLDASFLPSLPAITKKNSLASYETKLSQPRIIPQNFSSKQLLPKKSTNFLKPLLIQQKNLNSSPAKTQVSFKENNSCQSESDNSNDSDVDVNSSSIKALYQEIKNMKNELINHNNNRTEYSNDIKSNNKFENDSIKNLNLIESKKSTIKDAKIQEIFSESVSPQNNSIHLKKEELKELLDQHALNVVTKYCSGQNGMPPEECTDNSSVLYVDQHGNPLPYYNKNNFQEQNIFQSANPHMINNEHQNFLNQSKQNNFEYMMQLQAMSNMNPGNLFANMPYQQNNGNLWKEQLGFNNNENESEEDEDDENENDDKESDENVENSNDDNDEKDNDDDDDEKDDDDDEEDDDEDDDNDEDDKNEENADE